MLHKKSYKENTWEIPNITLPFLVLEIPSVKSSNLRHPSLEVQGGRGLVGITNYYNHQIFKHIFKAFKLQEHNIYRGGIQTSPEIFISCCRYSESWLSEAVGCFFARFFAVLLNFTN